MTPILWCTILKDENICPRNEFYENNQYEEYILLNDTMDEIVESGKKYTGWLSALFFASATMSTGKSALALFYRMNSSVQYEETTRTNRSYYHLSPSSYIIQRAIFQLATAMSQCYKIVDTTLIRLTLIQMSPKHGVSS